MSESLLNAEYTYDSAAGAFISDKHQRIAEVLNDYNQNLSLVWIPPAARVDTDLHPFAVKYHNESTGQQYIVSTFAEEDVNETLLAKIWTMDQAANNPLAYLQALEAANEAVRMKKELEVMEEAHDKARSIFKSPLHYYQLDKDRKLAL